MTRIRRNRKRIVAGIPVSVSLGLMILILLLTTVDAQAGVPITLYQSYAGNVDFTGTGGTLRAQSNPVNPCTLNPVSTGNLSGITGTVKAAYLYWAGSYDNAQGVPPDYNVTFNGNNITADRTFTELFVYTNNLNYFSGFKDVTAIVAAAGNGNYTFTNLTVNNGFPHCAPAAVLSGWSLVVIWEDASEPLRVINVFDGFQYYRGSSITLSPSNFNIPLTSIDGKQSHISWEGDMENSGALGGFTEDLQFNGVSLVDGQNPLNNQFNSTINILPSNTTYGVDHDLYDISPYLTPGDTLATSTYSSGADLVILSAEVISVTNTPVADLSVVKSHSGSFTVGQTGSYSMLVSNNGPSAVNSSVTVTDTLPTGLTYLSSSGTGWVADTSASPIIAWTHPGPLATGNSLPAIALSVNVLSAAAPTVSNVAAVASSIFDNISANDSSSDLTTVLQPNLSTSTKTVSDLNGPDADPGDTLRYTITLIESGGAAATGVTVTDSLPANATSLSVVSYPSGATDSSTGVLLDISNITVPAGSSDTIVFDVIVSGSANPGDLIDNTATIANPDGPGATPAASTIIVSQSQIVSSGNKPLYLTTSNLTRVVPGALGNVPINGGGAAANWSLNPALATTLVVDGSTGNIPVTLTLGEGGTPAQTRSYTITLSSSAIGGIATASFINVDVQPPITVTYNLPLTTPGDKTLPAGSTLTLTIANNTTQVNRLVVVNPNGSFVNLPSNTVINVDSALFYDAAYAGGSSITTTTLGTTVFVRGVISDPFGSFDIASADVTILDPLGTPMESGVAMTQVASSAATRTYEHTYTIPAAGPGGIWSAQIVATEGSEGVITHQRNASVTVPVADLAVVKSHSGTFIVGQSGSYNILVSNNGPASASTPITVTDILPAGLTYLSSSGTGWVADTSSLPTVIWSNPGPLSAGTALPGITMTVDVLAAALPTVTNTAAVASSTWDSVAANNTSSDLTTVIALANLSVTKLTQIINDPVNGALNPRAIPGAQLEYTIYITNMGLGAASTDTVMINDAVPAGTELFVDDLGGAGTGPVIFSDGVNASGLTFNYIGLGSPGDDVDFSNDGGSGFGHTPSPDGDGYDTSVPQVDWLLINPKGAMNASDGINHPSFTLRYRIRIQ